MSQRRSTSFRTRLFAAFLLASLVPLLICSTLLTQIFHIRMTDAAQADAQEHLDSALHVLDEGFQGLSRAADALWEDPLVAGALAGGDVGSTRVYARLFSATSAARDCARFDLYDLDGHWRYSTRNAPGVDLPTDWGVLQRAGEGGELVFSACEDPADESAPLLRGAAAVTGPDGARAGYLVVSLYQSDLRRLLEGSYGSQGTLLVLSTYWRPVYSAQPAQEAALAARLRSRLLSGQSLEAEGEDFLYCVAPHRDLGIYLLLRWPQAFTRETTHMLYMVELSCALICVVFGILTSWSLSRQMFRPIQRLQGAFRELEQDNLDVRVDRYRNDELGELAVRFNDMVTALKRNREQLVENQRKLNETQIRMLQAQLNPHFLCNTLDTMKWISKINKVPEVAVMSTDLADILRFCISPEEFAPLDRETQVLERYVEIQRIRLSDALRFTLSLPDSLRDCLIPKMILQPLVENAILHGVDGMADGEVHLEIVETAEGMLSLAVSDNGRGFAADMLGPFQASSRTRGHLGLTNVHTILTMYYGAGCGLTLANRTEGTGAVVTALLPIRRKEETAC